MIAAPLEGQRPSHRRRARRHRADPAQLRAHRADGRICGAGAWRARSASARPIAVAGRTAMSNASNVRIPRRSLGEAIERLREKWAAITAFGVLLVVLGFAALFFSLVATIVTVTLNGVLFLIAGAAEIGIGMHAREWGRFLPLGDRRPSLSRGRDPVHRQPRPRLGRADAPPRRGSHRRRSGAGLARLPDFPPTIRAGSSFLRPRSQFCSG